MSGQGTELELLTEMSKLLAAAYELLDSAVESERLRGWSFEMRGPLLDVSNRVSNKGSEIWAADHGTDRDREAVALFTAINREMEAKKR